MRLNIRERLVIPSLPFKNKGKFVEMVIVNDIINKTKITQDEIAELNIKTLDGGKISWSNDKSIDIEFTDLEINCIKDALNKLDESDELTNDHITLYRLFCINE